MTSTPETRVFHAVLLVCVVFIAGCISSPDPVEDPIILSWNLSSYQEIYGDKEILLAAQALDGLDSLEIRVNGGVLASWNPEGAGSDTFSVTWSAAGLSRGDQQLFEARASDLSGEEDSLPATCIVTDTLSLIPLAVGNRWEYDGLFTEHAGPDTLVDSFSWVMEIRGTTPVLDTTAYLLRVFEGEPIYDYSINFENGFCYLGGWNYGNEIVPPAPLLVWLYPPEEPGEYYSEMFDEMIEIVSVSNTVTVPAGTFDGCVHYRRYREEPQSSSGPSGSRGSIIDAGLWDRFPSAQKGVIQGENSGYSRQGDYYFLPGLGLLKMAFITIDGDIRIVETNELSSFSIY